MIRLLLSLSLLGCGSSTPAVEEPSELAERPAADRAVAPDSAPAATSFGTGTLSDLGGNPLLTLHDDGRVTLGAEPAGRFLGDGRIEDARGELTCILDAAGELEVVGESERYRITDAGELYVRVGPGEQVYEEPELILTIGDDGELEGRLTAELGASHFDGPAEARRWALVAILCTGG